MKNFYKSGIKGKLFLYLPIILLFFSVLNEFDFNNLGIKYFSFNFSYILIFYYRLKGDERLNHISIFIAGLFNDVVAGLPMGTSSLIFLLLCGFAAYLRNITLTPNLVKDWFFFLFAVLFLNSLSFIILNYFFGFTIEYFDEIINVIFTFIFYFIFSYFFSFFEKTFFGVHYVK